MALPDGSPRGNGADAGFPRLTQPDTSASSRKQAREGGWDFSLQVPKNIEPTTYLGSCFLLALNGFGVGDYFDRCQLILNVAEPQNLSGRWPCD